MKKAPVKMKKKSPGRGGAKLTSRKKLSAISKMTPAQRKKFDDFAKKEKAKGPAGPAKMMKKSPAKMKKMPKLGPKKLPTGGVKREASYYRRKQGMKR